MMPKESGRAGVRCLVIGPIGDKLAPLGSEERERYEAALEVLDAVIEPACKSNGVSIKRADSIHKGGEIPAQIYEALRDWEIVIADLTGANPNVMYELGLRHSVVGKCTVLISEHGGLPFDVQWIRTLEFVRTEMGLIDARKRLTAALVTILNESCDEITATRILNAVEGGKPTIEVDEPTTAGALVEEEPGFLDLLAEAEESMPRMTELIVEMSHVIEAIGGLASEATAEITLSDKSGGKVAAARLAIAKRFANALLLRAAELEDLVVAYEFEIGRVDRGVSYILDEFEAGGAPLQEGAEFFASVTKLRDVSQKSFASSTSLAEVMENVGKSSKVLRSPTQRVAASLRLLVDVASPIGRWADRIAFIRAKGRRGVSASAVRTQRKRKRRRKPSN